MSTLLCPVNWCVCARARKHGAAARAERNEMHAESGGATHLAKNSAEAFAAQEKRTQRREIRPIGAPVKNDAASELSPRI